MEQSALRPKPMPGQEPGGTGTSGGSGGVAGSARRRGRRITSALCTAFAGTVLVLAGVGLGTVGVTAIGVSGLAEPQPRATPSPPARPGPAQPAVSPAPVTATLGVEVVDAGTSGAMVVGVHVPGPGYAAGLVRGDVLLAFGTTRIDSAADLARAVAEARPGAEVRLSVRHRGGDHQRLTAVPGVVT